MSFDEMKARAREMMSAQMGNLIIVFLIYVLIFSGLSSFSIGLAWLVVYGPLSVGIAAILLKLDRGEVFNVEELFSGFNDFSRTLVAGLLVSLYTFLWSLLLIIPGIVAALSYSMTFFILSENPKLGAEDAITASKNMMMGHKGELFGLFFSFIGWWLLCLVTFGLALIYVLPYYECALTVFYQNLKQERGSL
ncbi:MAG TPA: DUF975 family protein [Candidatus Cloacimonadota bacterium]|nr:DUF975 family protein [Candidatus Cloacimonadota bacterium]